MSSPLRILGSPILALAVTVAAGPRARAADPPPVDLLQLDGAAIAVSSVVDNPRHGPEQLVDGKLETAWNSRSGDLAGAWIALRTPPKTRVTALRLTAGFAHKAGKVDLFTANHRLRRVRLWREGKRLGEHALDVNQRGLQEIPLAQTGGVFLLQVVETTPGVKPLWREVCISELQLLGHPATIATRGRARAFVGLLPLPAPPGRTSLLERAGKLVGVVDVAIVSNDQGTFAVSSDGRRKLQLNQLKAERAAFDLRLQALWLTVARDRAGYDLYVQDLVEGQAPVLVLDRMPVQVSVWSEREVLAGGIDDVTATLTVSTRKVELSVAGVGVAVAADPETLEQMEGPGRKRAARVERDGRKRLRQVALLQRLAARAGVVQRSCADGRMSTMLDLTKVGLGAFKDCEGDRCGQSTPIVGTPYYLATVQYGNMKEPNLRYAVWDPVRKRFLAIDDKDGAPLDLEGRVSVSPSGALLHVADKIYKLRGARKDGVTELALPGDEPRALGWLWPGCLLASGD
jgi:hypothetical protein